MRFRVASRGVHYLLELGRPGIGGMALGLYTGKSPFGGANRVVQEVRTQVKERISGMALGLYMKKLPFGGANRCVPRGNPAVRVCYRCLESFKIVINYDWTPIEGRDPGDHNSRRRA